MLLSDQSENEQKPHVYPNEYRFVSIQNFVICFSSFCCLSSYSVTSVARAQFLFQIAKATDSYQQLVEQGFPQLVNFLKGVNGFSDELAALEVIRLKTKSIIEKLLQPIEPMGLITHTDFWCNNLLVKEKVSDSGTAADTTCTDNESNDKCVDCVILDWQMITYSR